MIQLRLFFFSIFLFLILSHVNGQESVISELENQVRNAADDTTRLRLYSELTWEYLGVSLEKSDEYAQLELKLAESIHSDFYIASAYNDIGIVLIRKNRFRESLKTNKKALEIRQRINDKPGIASSYSKIGHCYTEMNQLSEAHDAQLKALALFRELNDQVKEAYTLNNLCVIYMNLQQYDKLETYANQSYRVLSRLGDKLGIANSLNYLATVEEYKGDFNKALQLELKSVQIREEELDSVNLEGAFNNVGIYYRKLGKTQEGLKYYLKALEVAQKLENPISIALYLCNIGNVYLDLKSYSKAEEYLLQAQEITLRDSVSANRSALFKSLADLYLLTNRKELALKYYDKSSLVKDSLFSESMAEKFTEMETRFETERTEQENALLLKENQLAAEALNRSRLITISILLLALLIGILAYLLYNRKQLQNKRKLDAELLVQHELRSLAAIDAEERERVRIARELHDGLGQQLSAARLTISGLQGIIQPADSKQIELFENATSLLDDAVKEVREVSHSMMANALIKNGLTGAINDFVQKLSSTNTIHADLEIVGMEERLNPTLETVLFRVFQELITNIIRHAKAKQISIQLIRHEQELVLVIEDDGVGFDSSQSKNSEGVGLKNIRSRVEYFKGQVHIDSTPDKGTTITVEIPV